MAGPSASRPLSTLPPISKAPRGAQWLALQPPMDGDVGAATVEGALNERVVVLVCGVVPQLGEFELGHHDGAPEVCCNGCY